ncbi:hypothetical protein HAX54_030870 [Datura stramonium]|uniref:Alcohol dehydrogenase-like C-terminal domain-containing protein n=1 Tax=Datura stramonium TaxID=4076 RepID=A0ABS8SBH9_DATST|nr:hypothetical protein [Datura stramonium]
MRPVYNSIHWDGTPTYGGYSTILVTDHRYVVHIPESLPMDEQHYLMGAGLTVYTIWLAIYLIHQETHGSNRFRSVGHMAIKFGKAFGHRVTVISTSPSKQKDAKDKLGAHDFILSTHLKQMQRNRRSLDFIIDTVSAKHSLGPYLELLKVNGIISIVGEPAQPIEVPATPLIYGKKVVRGSIIGSVKEIQEMMNFCGKHNILADIELVSTDQINEAFDRLSKNDVKFRFVLNVASNDIPSSSPQAGHLNFGNDRCSLQYEVIQVKMVLSFAEEETTPVDDGWRWLKCVASPICPSFVVVVLDKFSGGARISGLQIGNCDLLKLQTLLQQHTQNDRCNRTHDCRKAKRIAYS